MATGTIATGDRVRIFSALRWRPKQQRIEIKTGSRPLPVAVGNKKAFLLMAWPPTGMEIGWLISRIVAQAEPVTRPAGVLKPGQAIIPVDG